MKKTALALFISSLVASPSALSQESNNIIFSHTSSQDLFKPLNLSNTFAEKGAFNLQSGSLTLRVRALSNAGSNQLTSLFGVSNPQSNEQYINFFIQKVKNQPKNQPAEIYDMLSIEFRNRQDKTPTFQSLAVKLPPSQSEFRTITYTFDKPNNKIKIYVDGALVKDVTGMKFFADIPNLAAAYLGKTDRHTQSDWRSTDNMYHAELTRDILNADQVVAKHQTLIAQ